MFLNNLDDFIAPSQACVNPLFAGSSAGGGAGGGGGGTAGRITLESDLSTTEYDLRAPPVIVEPNLIKTKTVANQKIASVSLNDCLACSGCVTSAETVLIQEQSHDKLLARLSDRDGIVVVAISPQSRASIATALGLSSAEAFLRIASVLKAGGVTYVADTSSAGDVALLEAREEFMARYRSSRGSGGSSAAQWVMPPYTTAASATRVRQIDPTAAAAALSSPSSDVVGPVTASALQRSLPVLVSSCPGWVCYAEKTQPQALAFMSTAKSAQQILGVVLKQLLFPHGKGQGAVYVVSVQPCFDKKLEASRLDFAHDTDQAQEREVDLVLSTAELLSLLHALLVMQGLAPTGSDSSAASMAALLRAVAPDAPHGSDATEALLRRFSADGSRLVAASDSHGGSGGYLDYVFRYAAAELCGADLWGAASAGGGRPALDWRAGRNPDMAEVELVPAPIGMDVVADPEHQQGTNEAASGRPSLRFARVYGFSNIQSVLLKLKRGKCDLDFVEVMACPSGCVNGGGQLKGPSASSTLSVSEEGHRESPSEARARVARVEAEFHAATDVARPEDSPLARFLYDQSGIGAPLSARALELFHTRFHAVPKLELVAPLAARW